MMRMFVYGIYGELFEYVLFLTFVADKRFETRYHVCVRSQS